MKNLFCRCATGMALMFSLSMSVPAQAVVVPNSLENTPGNATFLGPLTVGPRTYQLLIHESQLTGLLNQPINGVTWRLPTSATADWPATDVSYTAFDIYLSGSVDPSLRSLTFADNIVGPQTQVRSGPLTILANSFKSGESPNSFGSEITFDTPYLYGGGNLLLELRHTGHGSASRSVDAAGTSSAGYGTLFSAAWQSSYTATSGLQGNAIVTQFSLIPEPGSIALALAGGSMLLLRRYRARRR